MTSCPNGHPVIASARFCGRCGAGVEHSSGGGRAVIGFLIVFLLGGLGAIGAGLFLLYARPARAGTPAELPAVPPPPPPRSATVPTGQPPPLEPLRCVDPTHRFAVQFPPWWAVAPDGEVICARLSPGPGTPGAVAWVTVVPDAGDLATAVAAASSIATEVTAVSHAGRPATRVTSGAAVTWVIDRGGRAFVIRLAMPAETLGRALESDAAHSVVAAVQIE